MWGGMVWEGSQNIQCSWTTHVTVVVVGGGGNAKPIFRASMRTLGTDSLATISRSVLALFLYNNCHDTMRSYNRSTLQTYMQYNIHVAKHDLHRSLQTCHAINV